MVKLKGFIIILCMMLIALAPSVLGALTDGLIQAYRFENESGTRASDSMNNSWGNINGADLNQTGYIDKAFYFNGALGDNVNLSASHLWDSVFRNRTYSFMFLANATGDIKNMLYDFNTLTKFQIYMRLAGAVYNISAAGQIGGAWEYVSWSGGGIVTGTWYHVVVVVNQGHNLMLYVNGLSRNNNSIGSGFTASAGDKTTIGYTTADTLTGVIDEVYFWNRTLSSAEISALYSNLSNGCPVPFNCGAPPPNYFSVTAKDLWDNSAILNFSAVINGTTYNTTNGTVNSNILNSASVYVDVNVSSNYNGGYFSRDYNYNVSSDLEAQLYQSVITLAGVEVVSGSGVNNFRVNSTRDNETASGSMIFRFKAGTYEINVSSSGYSPAYYNFSENITINALDNKTINLSFYNAIFDLFVREILTNVTVNNYTVNVSSNDYSWGGSYSGENNHTVFYLINGSFNFTVDASPIFAIKNETVSVVNGSGGDTIYLYSSNSLWVYARDEDTGSVISNYTVLVYNANNSYLNITNNSVAIFDNVSAGIYTVRVTSSGYSVRYYNVTMSSGSHVDLTAYLSVIAGNTTLIFVDTYTSDILAGVSYGMYRIINGSWTAVSSGSSDITGRVFLTYSPYTEYKFICSFAGYETKEFLLTPVFSSYTIKMIPIYTGEINLTYGFISAYLTPSILSNNVNNNVTLYISSPYGTLIEYGLNLSYKGVDNGDTGNNAIGGSVTVNISISGASLGDYVLATYFFNESNGNYRVFTRVYPLFNATPSNYSFEALKDSHFGLGDFELVLISVLISLCMAGVGAIVGGGLGAGITGILSLSVFAYLGYVPLWAFLPFILIAVLFLVSSLRGGF